MPILDDIEVIKGMDTNNDLGTLDTFPEMIQRLHFLSKKAGIRLQRGLDNIYIMGDADGRIAGYLLQTLLSYDIEIPIMVERAESIPGFISEKTLVFVIFQPSQKEDVVKKINRCAHKEAGIICITEEGVNLEDISQTKVEVLRIPTDLGYCFKNHYIFIAILHFLLRNNLIKDFDSDLDETVGILNCLKEDYSLIVPSGSNPAKETAIRLYQSLIFFYGSCGTTDSIAKRWSFLLRKRHYLTEISIFPDADREQPFLNIPNIGLEKRIVFLMDNADDYRVVNKYDRLKNIAIQKNVGVIELYGTGKSKLSKMITLNFLIDFVNSYLSFLEIAQDHQLFP